MIDSAPKKWPEDTFIFDAGIRSISHEMHLKLLAMDRENVGTPDYMGLAYFWHYDYRHLCRPLSTARCRKAHELILKAGLHPAESTPAHDRVLADYLRDESIITYFAQWRTSPDYPEWYRPTTKDETRGKEK